MRSLYFSITMGITISITGYQLAMLGAINHGLMLSGLIILTFSLYGVAQHVKKHQLLQAYKPVSKPALYASSLSNRHTS